MGHLSEAMTEIKNSVRRVAQDHVWQKFSVIGLRVRSLCDFAGVPKGTEGIVDEIYDVGEYSGVMVAWDLPEQPLPAGYQAYDGRPAFVSGILRDGFGEDELEMLELIEQ